MNDTRNRNPIQFPAKWSISQLAALLQQDRRTIGEKLVKLRVPHEDGPKNAKLYDLQDVLKALYQPQKSTDENGQVIDDSVSLLDQERMLLTKAKREKAELELAVSRNEFVAVSEVVENVEKEYSLIRNALRALPAALSKHIANTKDPAEINAILTTAMDDVLAELAGDAENEIKQIASQSEMKKQLEDSSDNSEVDTETLIEEKVEESLDDGN